jgi:hypothetical protein
LTLQFPDRPVAVDPHNQHTAVLAGAFKVPNVADVEQVKASIGEDNSMAFLP